MHISTHIFIAKNQEKLTLKKNMAKENGLALTFLSPNSSSSFLVVQRLKGLPGMRKTRVQSLGREEPLEKEMATHSSTLVWRIPWREEPSRLQSLGSQRVRHN